MTKSILALTTALTLIVMTGCDKEGPAEKAGKKIDKGVEKVKETAKDVKESVKEKLSNSK